MTGDTVDRTALEWFVRLRSLPGPSAEDRRAFARWLEAAPSHQHHFAEAERAWAQSEAAARRVAEEDAEALGRLLARMDVPVPRQRFRITAWAAALGCLLLLTGGLWLERPHLLQDMSADQVTARGERRVLALADGSVVTLDADSAVTLDFSAGERRVVVLRGGAFFAVSHDGRPFTVAVPEGDIRVLGTRFDVHIQDGNAQVAVADGRVGVHPADGEALVLGRGQAARFSAVEAGAAIAVDPEAVAAWRDGRLVFHDARLAEVVEAIARHHAGRILILDESLAGRRVSGTFPALDPAAALASLQGVLGFRQRSIAGRLILLD